MARMTLRLPDSLRDALTERAEQEGVSLNQFLVFLLSQASAVDAVRRQREQFEAMRHRVPPEEAEHALAQLLAERK